MKRLQCLDGLRGVLAVYVMLGHMAPFAAMPGGIAHALSHGGAAVDVFFMLSGLVILRSLESFRYRAQPFLIARVARIFPVYLVMFAVALCVQAVPIAYASMPWIATDSPARDIWSSGWPANWPMQVLVHLGMLHGLFPDGVLPCVWVSFLGSAWSLSTEWQFYVLAVLVAGRLGARRTAALLLALAALGLVWRIAVPAPWQFSRAFLPNRAQFFAVGIAGAVLLRGEPGAARFYLAVLAATLLLCLADFRADKLLPPLVWTLCLAAEAWPRPWPLRVLARVLRLPVMLRLGALSYAIYLANEPVQKLLGVALARMAGGDPALFTAVWLPAAALLPVLAAVGLHRWVERPALRAGRTLAEASLLRRRYSRRRNPRRLIGADSAGCDGDHTRNVMVGDGRSSTSVAVEVMETCGRPAFAGHDDCRAADAPSR